MNKEKAKTFSGIAIMFIAILCFMYILREKVYCGTVTNKINTVEYNKNVSRPDPILIVYFDGYKKKEIHTNWITFTEANLGGRICFSKNVIEMEGKVDNGVYGLIITIIFVIGLMVFLSGLGAFDPERSW